MRVPIERQGAKINDEALDKIITQSNGYPFFLKEWGYQAWNAATEAPITVQDAAQASVKALARLDSGFFKVRKDRLTPAEVDYVNAMAGLGRGPYRSTEIASALKMENSALSPRRASIIKKGMIYSPEHGSAVRRFPAPPQCITTLSPYPESFPMRHKMFAEGYFADYKSDRQVAG